MLAARHLYFLKCSLLARHIWSLLLLAKINALLACSQVLAKTIRYPFKCFVDFVPGGLSFKKERAARWTFWQESLRRSQDPILWPNCGRGLEWFLPLRVTTSKAQHYLLSNFFHLTTLKRTEKLCCEPFETPKIPILFLWNSLPENLLHAISEKEILYDSMSTESG